MKTKVLILTSALFAAHILPATSITFNVEVGSIFVDGVSADQSNVGDLELTALGFFVSAGNYDGFIANEAWNLQDPLSITEQSVSSIVEVLAGLPRFSEIQPLGIVPDAAPDAFGVFREQIDAGAAGFHPVLIVHNATSIESLGVGSSLGIVTSSDVTDEFSNIVVGFNTVESWDTTLLGQPGSLTLATVVPEPSSFAALAGVMTLGFVMMRRRRA